MNFVPILNTLQKEQALIITAPPGWGKTYKLLNAIKQTKKKVCFLFPLRALCEEVYLQAHARKIECINLKTKEDFEIVHKAQPRLVITTPEMLDHVIDSMEEYTFIFDEAHLFFYWGDCFRQKLLEIYYDILSRSQPVFFLSATMGSSLKSRLASDLEYNYQNIFHLDFGNQILKNLPTKIYYYPKFMKLWLDDEIHYGKVDGVQVIFCEFRNQVKDIREQLEKRGHRVLSCVGGQAKEFSEKLNTGLIPDFIVATSVISHGVNLPMISKVFFLYEVENLDFYLQMVGRGGRAGDSFEIHTLNLNYFKWYQYSIFSLLIKRFRNRVKSLLYSCYAY